MAGLLLTQTLGHGASFACRCPPHTLQSTALNERFYFSLSLKSTGIPSRFLFLDLFSLFSTCFCVENPSRGNGKCPAIHMTMENKCAKA